MQRIDNLSSLLFYILTKFPSYEMLLQEIWNMKC